MDAGELVVKITGDASGLESAIAGVESSLAGLNGKSGSATGVGKGFEGAAKGANAASAATKSLGEKVTAAGGKIKSFGSTLDTVTKPLQVTSAALAAGGVASAKFAVDFENNFAKVKKTVEGTPEQLEAVKQNIIALTTTGIGGRNAIPATTAELTELAAAGGQLGIQTENIAEFTEVMAQMGSATNLAGEEGASTLARLMNVTNTSQSQVRNMGSAIVDLGNNFATTESEISELAMRMGATGSIVGISAQDILGYSTALSSMGIEAEAGGSAVSRIWMDIQTAVSEGGEGLQTFAEVSGKTSQEFAQQWKTDASGAFQSFIQGLSKSDDQIGTLADLGFNNIRDIQALQRLASDRGIELVTDALNRSNTAWEKNTALQKEADAMAETTAGQIQITKNNIVEAARSLGETMLPVVSKASTGVREFAQHIAGLSDEQKESLVKTGAVVTAIGAGAKVVSSAAKGIGSFVEGWGKITPLLTKIPTPALAAAAGITALGVAAGVAYNVWDKHENRWAEDFSESAADLSKAANEYAQIQELRQQYNQAQAVLSNPTASAADIDAAKSKIEEIKGLLEQEYKLTISADTTNLDSAFEMLDARSRLDLMEKGSDAMKKLTSATEKYKESEADLARYDADSKAYQDQITKLSELGQKTQELSDAQKSGTITQDEYRNRLSALNQEWSELTHGMGEKAPTADALNNAINNQIGTTSMLLEQLGNDYKTALEQREKFQASVQEAGDAYSQLLASDVANGNTANIGYDEMQLKKVGEAAAQAGLSTQELAQSFAVAKSGYTDFSAAVADGKAAEMANNFIQFQKDIGSFNTDMAGTIQTAALMKNGFAEVTPALQQNSQAVQAVIRDMQSLGQQHGLFDGMDNSSIAAQMTEMAQAMELIPDSKHIEFDVDSGSMEVVDSMKTAMEDLNSTEGAEISVHVNGDGVQEIETTNQKLQELMANSEVTVSIKYNNDGSFAGGDIFSDGNKVGEITAEGTINWVNGTQEDPEDGEASVDYDKGSQEDPDDGDASVNYSAGDQAEPEDGSATVNYSVGESPSEVPSASGTANFTAGTTPTTVPSATGTANFGLGTSPSAVPAATGSANFNLGSSPSSVPSASGTANYTLGSYPTSVPSITGVVNYVIGSMPSLSKSVHIDARGTDYHPGGLALVNDQAGAADPRELIVDQGRAFIPEGRNVLLPLSAGAKVYTARQTRDIMRSFGIKRYASGKDNSDAFTEARDNLTHITKITALSTAEELEKWVELSKEFTDNMEDVKDIEEEVYSLTVKLNEERNKESTKYAENIAKYYQWDFDNGDTDYEMFNRIDARNKAELEAGRLTWADYVDERNEVGQTILDARMQESYDWIERQKKFFDMSVDDEIAAYQRMNTYVQEYYDNGLISYADYMDAHSEVDDKYLEAYTDKMETAADELEDFREKTADAYYDSADNWKKIRDTFDDWDEYDDSEEQYYLRRLASTERLYREGNIDWQDYMDNSMDDYLEMYTAIKDRFDDELDAFRDEISETEKEFSAEEQELRDSWDVEDRDTDLSEVNRLLGYYENAVTSSGQEKYKDLLEQKKQLEREEELYDLQQDHADTLEDLEDEYTDMEERNARELSNFKQDYFTLFSNANSDIINDTSQISELAKNIQDKLDDGSGNTVTGLLKSLIEAVKANGKSSSSSSSSSGGSSRKTTTISIGDAGAAYAIKKMTGTVVSGLGDVVLG